MLGWATGLCTCWSYCWADPFYEPHSNRLRAPAEVVGLLSLSGQDPHSTFHSLVAPLVWGLCEAVFLVPRAGPGPEETLGCLSEQLPVPEAHGDAPHSCHLHPSLAIHLGRGVPALPFFRTMCSLRAGTQRVSVLNSNLTILLTYLQVQDAYKMLLW